MGQQQQKVVNPYFAGMEKAEHQGSGISINEDGDYRIKVLKCLTHVSKKTSELLFFAEFEILETANPDKHPVGCKRSWCVKMTDRKQAATKFREFVVALLGKDETRDAEEIERVIVPNLPMIMTEATDEEQVFEGRTARLTVQIIKTVKTQSDFSKHIWAPDLTQAAS